MRLAVPHTLGRDEVRRRMHARSDELAVMSKVDLVLTYTAVEEAVIKARK